MHAGRPPSSESSQQRSRHWRAACTGAPVCMHACIHACGYVYMYACACAYACVCLCGIGTPRARAHELRVPRGSVAPVLHAAVHRVHQVVHRAEWVIMVVRRRPPRAGEATHLLRDLALRDVIWAEVRFACGAVVVERSPIVANRLHAGVEGDGQLRQPIAVCTRMRKVCFGCVRACVRACVRPCMLFVVCVHAYTYTCSRVYV